MIEQVGKCMKQKEGRLKMREDKERTEEQLELNFWGSVR
jgi:hypothetical protein